MKHNLILDQLLTKLIRKFLLTLMIKLWLVRENPERTRQKTYIDLCQASVKVHQGINDSSHRYAATPLVFSQYLEKKLCPESSWCNLWNPPW